MPYTEEFEILSRIDNGSFGTILKVRHRESGYIRAIKELRNVGELSEGDKNKFEQECKTLLRLSSGNHPNIVTIYNVHLEEEPPYYEMAWIEGETFDDISAGKFMGIDEVYQFIKDIGNALSFCHNGGIDGNERGIVHNDLHPYNIKRSIIDGRYVLLDFGLARENYSQITGTFINTGAVEYISPERCDIQENGSTSEYTKEEAITTKWDMYSFGCLIYQALTGQPPFMLYKRINRYGLNEGGLTQKQIWHAHKKTDPYSIETLRKQLYNRTHPNEEIPPEEECPDWLVNMVNKCLAKKEEERYRNAQVFMTAFEGQYKNEAKVSWRTYDKVKRELNENKEKLCQLNEDISSLNIQLHQKEEEVKELQEKQKILNSKKRIYLWIASAIAIILAIATNCWAIFVEPKDTILVINTYLLSGLAAVILSILIYSEIQFVKSKK